MPAALSVTAFSHTRHSCHCTCASVTLFLLPLITYSFIIVALGAALCHSSIPLAQRAFTALSHWSGSEPLPSATPSILDPHQDFSQMSCCCPESWRYCSYGSTELASSHDPAAHRRGRCWGGPTKALNLDLDGRGAGQLRFSLGLPSQCGSW